jgi:hypothetical protein
VLTTGILDRVFATILIETRSIVAPWPVHCLPNVVIFLAVPVCSRVVVLPTTPRRASVKL